MTSRIPQQLFRGVLSRYPTLKTAKKWQIHNLSTTNYAERHNKTSSCLYFLQSLRSLHSGSTACTDGSKVNLSGIAQIDAKNNDITDEVLPDLVKIIKERSKFRTPNLKYLGGLVNILVSFKLKPAEVIECLAENHEEINKIGHEKLQENVEYLRINGFHPAEVCLLLKNYPQILSMKKEKIIQSIQAYMAVGVSDGRIQLLLAREPALFHLTQKEIARRVENLGLYFSRKEIIDIVGTYPNVFLDTWENIERKFSYVINVMGLDEMQLKKFEIFNHSLLHMKIRHRMLHKAGLYQKPDKLGTTEIENASIARIMDSSDKVFARQVVGMSLEELEAFKKMEELESILESLEEEESDDDDDDDDESDDDDDDDTDDNDIKDKLENVSKADEITLKRISKLRRNKIR